MSYAPFIAAAAPQFFGIDAYDQLPNLKDLASLLGHAQAGDDAVWRLIEGPLHLVLAYTDQQASCELQKQWQAQVEWPLQAAPTSAAVRDQLYGEKGSFWAFVDGVAKPFLERDAQHFRIVRTLGYSVPFTNAFLQMLNNAAGKRKRSSNARWPISNRRRTRPSCSRRN